MEIQEQPICLQEMREKMALAESLARANLMTCPAAKRRLVARSLELKFGSLDEQSGDFIPPRQLLQYMVRMGSISSSPRFINDDNQDNIFTLPENISRQELLQFCQKQHEDHPMVKRAFRRANQTNKDTLDYTLKFRKLNLVSKGCSDYISCPSTLRVFQWNVLSQALGVMNDNFVRCPMEALEWTYRRYHMIEEMIEYAPDVICLQEVDHFNFLKYVLDKQGYSGVFYPKPDSPTIYIEGNNGPDGCAIFYRKNKFDLMKTECRIIEIWRVQSNQVAVLMVLRIKETGQEVCVLTTHLKARKGALLSTLRNEQGKDLLQFVNQHAGDRPIIMCGDFNAEPTEPVYNTLLSDKHLRLASAYADESEPAYTTWKIREEGEVCHTIDYVFYTKDKLEVDGVLEFPTGEEIGSHRLPSMTYPSDHFSLVCDFKLG